MTKENELKMRELADKYDAASSKEEKDRIFFEDMIDLAMVDLRKRNTSTENNP